ncbi:hypothetical protein I350_02573 [Cryptococcus amylolentus CBS 6273]|uniref:F-box domain-containing protein n=1 Tax=Cryptococcus amylolentus CBS 6273 TaxID=1296118 RepID=A0A1E3K7D9_9TREE|nr:hypothetical protein I350_02573 [Cryptococcus amylolentus CBS 6273]
MASAFTSRLISRPSPTILYHPFQLLQPIYHTLIDYLFLASPLSCLRLSRYHYNHYIPLLYDRVVITKGKVDIWTTALKRAKPRDLVDVAVVMRQCTKVLTLPDWEGLHGVVYMPDDRVAFPGVTSVLVPPRLFAACPEGRRAGAMEDLEILLSERCGSVRNLVVQLGAVDVRTALPQLHSPAKLNFPHHYHLNAETLTVCVPVIPVGASDPFVWQDYINNVADIAISWAVKSRIRYLFKMDDKTYKSLEYRRTFCIALIGIISQLGSFFTRTPSCPIQIQLLLCHPLAEPTIDFVRKNTVQVLAPSLGENKARLMSFLDDMLEIKKVSAEEAMWAVEGWD